MKKCNKYLHKIYLTFIVLLVIGSNQKAFSQIVVAELGYSPIGVFTNDVGVMRNVTAIGANIITDSKRMVGLTLDYSNSSLDFEDRSLGFFTSGKIAKITYNSSLIRLNYTRYVYLLGELDVPFQCFLTGGYSLGFENRSSSLNNKNEFTTTEIDDIKGDYYGFNSVSYVHMQVVLGVAMQYNFTRNIGLRGELNYGSGFSNTDEVISGSIFPKLSLCYKPDYIFR